MCKLNKIIIRKTFSYLLPNLKITIAEQDQNTINNHVCKFYNLWNWEWVIPPVLMSIIRLIIEHYEICIHVAIDCARYHCSRIKDSNTKNGWNWNKKCAPHSHVRLEFFTREKSTVLNRGVRKRGLSLCNLSFVAYFLLVW